MVCESKIRWGIEVPALNEALQEIDKVRGNFCNELLELPRYAANGSVEMNLVERAGEAVAWDRLVKYGYQIMCVDVEILVKRCFEWQE